jgi:hypothetical protein
MLFDHGAVFENWTGTENLEASESRHILQNLEKFSEIRKNSTEMYLISERNRIVLKTRKSDKQ